MNLDYLEKKKETTNSILLGVIKDKTRRGLHCNRSQISFVKFILLMVFQISTTASRGSTYGFNICSMIFYVPVHLQNSGYA